MGEADHLANGRDELVQLRLSYHQRRSRFEGHEVITAYLGEDVCIAKLFSPKVEACTIERFSEPNTASDTASE